ncbi:MAG: hypothetical protein RIS91_809 [Bacteroidota bacterium]|jgi:hypothetical protein
MKLTELMRQNKSRTHNSTYKSWRVKCELASICFVLNASASQHISASNAATNL